MRHPAAFCLNSRRHPQAPPHISAPALRSLHDVLDWDGARGAWLGTFLVHEPSRALPLFEEAIRAVQRSVMAAHEDGHFMSVKPSVHVRRPRSPQPPLTR